MSIELRPHEIEALLCRHDAPRLLVRETQVSPELKYKGKPDEDPNLSDAAILRNASSIAARAIARGTLKVIPGNHKINTRNYAHKAGRRWTPEQRAAHSARLRGTIFPGRSKYYRKPLNS